ncbi:MAG: hypothetical protein WC552_09915 [Candidatus Omnitrophota bacterium]
MAEDTKLINQQQSHRQWVDGLLVSAQNRKWFGKITIEIRRGMIDLVKQEESLKPPSD